MKGLKVVTGLVMVAVLLVVGVLPAFAAEQTEIVFKTAQLYPVTVTDEWEDMSREERVAACQLSEEDIDEMSTEELLQYVLNYPFMVDIYAFSTFEQGFYHVFEEFEAISLLVDREDYGETLIDTYAAVPVVTSVQTRSNTDYQNIWDLGILEILIAQPEMTETLSSSEIADLATTADKKFDEKMDALDVYSGSCESFAQALNENPDSAIALAARSPVRTPNGTDVPVYNHSNIVDWTSAEKATLNAQALASYPTATLLRDATKKYNCHSYAWYSMSSSNYYWMDDPTVYMTDGSYYSTSRKIGNVAYWYAPINGVNYPIHSGIVDEHMQSAAFYGARSKWGQLGLFNHKYDDCPYGGSISYWAKS